MAIPDVIARGAAAVVHGLLGIRIGFSLLVLAGFWLTYFGWRAASPPD
jgi:hypothetical protein